MSRLWLLMIIVVTLTAPVVASGGEEKSKPWYEQMELNGDLRFRYEGFQQDGAFDDGRRDRVRYRFRFGLESRVTDYMQLGFQLRSGDPNDPVSDNQSLGGGFNKDTISIAEIFAEFRTPKYFEAIVGKFSRGNYWLVPDLQWDGDVVFEGAVQRLDLPVSEGFFRELEASFYQLVLDENGDASDAFLFGAQLLPKLQVTRSNGLTLGLTFDYYVNPQSVVNLTASGDLGGNDMTNLVDDSGTLVSDFRILQALAIWRNHSIQRWPVTLSFFFYKNTGASDRTGFENGITGAELVASENDNANFFRIEAGGFDELGRMEFRYTHYYSQPDGLFYAHVQSDTRRATNVDGHRFDWRLGLPAGTFANVTYYRTYPARGDDATLNGWQVDYIVRF